MKHDVKAALRGLLEIICKTGEIEVFPPIPTYDVDHDFRNEDIAARVKAAQAALEGD